MRLLGFQAQTHCRNPNFSLPASQWLATQPDETPNCEPVTRQDGTASAYRSKGPKLVLKTVPNPKLLDGERGKRMDTQKKHLVTKASQVFERGPGPPKPCNPTFFPEAEGVAPKIRRGRRLDPLHFGKKTSRKKTKEKQNKNGSIVGPPGFRERKKQEAQYSGNYPVVRGAGRYPLVGGLDLENLNGSLPLVGQWGFRSRRRSTTKPPITGKLTYFPPCACFVPWKKGSICPTAIDSLNQLAEIEHIF